jgi:predicted DNA-binding transcriptional regulator AlpA
MRRDAEPKTPTPEAGKLPTGAGRPLREREAAARLGLTGNALAKWRCRRFGPRYIRFGRTIRYYENDLNAWLNEHAVEPEQREEAS